MPFRRVHYGYRILAVSALLMAGVIGFARFGYSLVLPDMKRALALSYTESGLLQTANFAIYTIALLLVGPVAGRLGAPRLATLSVLLLGLATAFTGAARGFDDALAMRLVAGVATAGAYVPTAALAAAWFVSARRGLASGIMMGGTGIGILVSGWMVPLLLAGNGGTGWRLGWAALGLPVAGLALLAHLVLRSSPAELGLQPIGGAAAADRPPLKPPKVSIYRWWPIWHLGLVYLLYGIAFSGYTTFFTAYAIAEGGLATAEAGRLWSGIGALSLASGALWGQCSDRIGRGRGLGLALAIQTVGYGVIAIWPAPAGFLASVVLYGSTAWAVPAIITAACGDFAGQRQAAAAIGLTVAVHAVGLVLGPFSFGLIGDRAGTLAPALLLGAGLSALAALLAFGLARPGRIRAARSHGDAPAAPR